MNVLPKLRRLPGSPNTRSFAAALFCSSALLAWSLWRTLGDAARQYESARVTRSIADTGLWQTSFRGDAIEFVLALAGLHLILCLLIWGAVRLAVFAYPRLHTRADRIALAIGSIAIAWILVANAQWYPLSRWVREARWLDFSIGVNFGSYHVLTMLLSAAAIAIIGGAIAQSGRYRKFWIRTVVYSASAAIGMWLWSVRSLAADEADVKSSRPHIIVIGIDSLRPDVVGLGQRIAFTPNLDRFASEASIFTDAITPLARTFPAWVSILTGRHPTRTGARENLLNPESLSLPPTLPELLRAKGYRTFYGTDEVRFSNIDERYGFDDVIGPRMGASDFLITPISDMPLSNLVVNTAVGRWLFPNSYVNRAAAVTYQPETFVHELDRRLDFSAPAFVALHLTLPHWPYHWGSSDDDPLAGSHSNRYAYAASVAEADRQFGQLIEVLARKGALQSAIVVVLSDHGEALGLPGDNLIRSKEARQAVGSVPVNMHGHGNSVLSRSQYEVFLAFRAFGSVSGIFSGIGRFLDQPVSLEDVTPTLLSFAEVADPVDRDGISLKPLLEGDEAAAEALESRLRFTETGITVGFTREGQVDVQELVDQNIRYYKANAKTSRIELNSTFIPALMLAKERAVLSRDWLLAAVPGDDPGKFRYLAVRRSGGYARIVGQNHEASADGEEIQSMWAALHERFGDELSDSSNSVRVR